MVVFLGLVALDVQQDNILGQVLQLNLVRCQLVSHLGLVARVVEQDPAQPPRQGQKLVVIEKETLLSLQGFLFLLKYN